LATSNSNNEETTGRIVSNKQDAVTAQLQKKDTGLLANNTTKGVDSLIKKKDTTQAQPTDQTATTKKLKQKKRLQFGLQWGTPFSTGANLLDVNAKQQPLSLLVPQVWVGKQLAKRQSIKLGINPYSSFYTNNKAVTSINHYNIIVTKGAANAETINYTETVALNKLMGVEASLVYDYQVSPKLMVGIGVSCNKVYNALMQNKVTRNYAQVTRDSLYGIDKTSRAWAFVNPNFWAATIETGYTYRRWTIGANLVVPMSRFTNGTVTYTTPVNANLFLRCRVW
jgi:hypothetical protein